MAGTMRGFNAIVLEVTCANVLGAAIIRIAIGR